SCAHSALLRIVGDGGHPRSGGFSVLNDGATHTNSQEPRTTARFPLLQAMDILAFVADAHRPRIAIDMLSIAHWYGASEKKHSIQQRPDRDGSSGVLEAMQ